MWPGPNAKSDCFLRSSLQSTQCRLKCFAFLMSLCEIIQNEYCITSENEVVNDERNCDTISTSGDNCVINEFETYILFPVYVSRFINMDRYQMITVIRLKQIRSLTK